MNNEIKNEDNNIKRKTKSLNKKSILIFILAIIILLILLYLLFIRGTNISKYISKINNKDEEKVTNVKENNVEIVNKDIFSKYYSYAEEYISQMSIEEKAAQMCFSRCPDSGQIEEVKSYLPGGYVLFGRDFKDETKTSVITKIESYQRNSKIPMLIGVDEEGGTVTRVSRYTQFRNEPFKSAQELYNIGGLELLKSDTNEKIDLLVSLGINVNLAPVADISTNSSDYIFLRTLGKNATLTSEYIKEMTNCYNTKKMGMTLKHFPGYGNNPDTHADFVRDTRSEENFRTSDFIPFQAGITEGAQSILVAHNVVEWKDKENPASLSKAWHELLRNELGFTGIIMTDDLTMGAIANVYTVEEAAIKAVNAGNDMLITSDLKTCVNAIVDGVKNGSIKEEDINLAVKRIISWKYYLGLIKD